MLKTKNARMGIFYGTIFSLNAAFYFYVCGWTLQGFGWALGVPFVILGSGYLLWKMTLWITAGE